jgi:hypothetical protein
MQPASDHGETSYRGSGRLLGRKALIAGGDSGMGRAAAIAFAREGADVSINYLPDEQPDANDVIGLIRAVKIWSSSWFPRCRETHYRKVSTGPKIDPHIMYPSILNGPNRQ